jgi:diguanylate cyclase (GGDEF)-like protein
MYICLDIQYFIDFFGLKRLSSNIGLHVRFLFPPSLNPAYKIMNPSIVKVDNSLRPERSRPGGNFLLFGAGAVAAIILIFVLADSDADRTIKLAGLAGVVGVYLMCCFAAYRINRPGGSIAHSNESEAVTPGTTLTDEVRNKLSSLEDANEFFGSSLKPVDMFRLVFSRVSEIVPVSACVLFVPNHDRSKWKAEYVEGRRSHFLQSLEFDASEGLAGIAAATRSIITDESIFHDAKLLSAEFRDGFRSAVALPLVEDGETFAVFQMYNDEPADASGTPSLYESLAERLTPIFLRSMAFARSLSNALSDPLTNLPNERAFFMILENQLAESQRYRDERPLTVLAMDIKNFSDVNSTFGHATGDRILSFAAKTIRGQLRKMDFLARSINDEFVAILPNAPGSTADEIIERVRSAFASDPFEISGDDTLKVWLNFGAATFWHDGDTAQQLLQNAQIRKQQAKSEEPAKVLWFPKEYVN